MARERSYDYFWNSNSDRYYDAESMGDWLRPFFKNGVFNGQMQVTANDNMSVTIAAGYGYINGKHRHFLTPTTLDIETASGTLDRIDSVILRRNDTERRIYLLIEKGGNAKSPVAPAPTRDGAIYDLKLAEIHITAGTVKITQAEITDTRMNSDVCGWVMATSKEIDFSQITAQFQAFFSQYQEDVAQEFNSYRAQLEAYTEQQQAVFSEWFDQIKGNLSGDAAGNLQNQINNIRATSIDGVVLKNNVNRRYESCKTEAGIQQKTVTIPNIELRYGTRISVKFLNGNISIGATLNVNGTGDFPILYKDKVVDENLIKPNTTVDLVYTNGGRWHIVGELTQSQIDEILSILTVSTDEMNIKDNYLWTESRDEFSAPIVERNGTTYEGAQSAEIAVVPGKTYKIYTCDIGHGKENVFVAISKNMRDDGSYSQGDYRCMDAPQTAGKDVFMVTIPDGFDRLLINSWSKDFQEIKVYKCP